MDDFAIYPCGLPQPDTAPVNSRERRAFSNLPGRKDSRYKQRDFGGSQSITLTLSPAQAGVFNNWYKADLVNGGSWFSADWPFPSDPDKYNQFRVRKIISPLRWSHIPGGHWQVSFDTEIRGKGYTPTRVCPIGGGGAGWGACTLGTEADEFWMLSTIYGNGNGSINQFDIGRPEDGYTDLLAPDVFVPYFPGYGQLSSFLYSHQYALFRRYTVLRTLSGALVSATPKTDTSVPAFTSGPSYNYQQLTGESEATIANLIDYVGSDEPTITDGSIWYLQVPAFSSFSAIMLLGSPNRTVVSFLSTDLYPDVSSEYVCGYTP